MSKGAGHHCYHHYVSVVGIVVVGLQKASCRQQNHCHPYPVVPDPYAVRYPCYEDKCHCSSVTADFLQWRLSPLHPSPARQQPGQQFLQQQLDSIQVLNVSNTCQTAARPSTSPTTARQHPGPQRPQCLRQQPGSIQTSTSSTSPTTARQYPDLNVLNVSNISQAVSRPQRPQQPSDAD